MTQIAETKQSSAVLRPYLVSNAAAIIRASVLTAVVAALCLTIQAPPASAQSTVAATTPAAPATYSQAQLEQLVAPIALYPDDLMSQVLMASTYPLEVVQAARWVKDNSGLTGQALEDAMAKQPWDPSVKGLVAVPQTLEMMSNKLDWTQQLGDAFLAQQDAVLDAVQRLRQRAEGAGNLQTTTQQKVVKLSQPGPSGQPVERYVIERVDPQVAYVPVYDPGVVYGAWPYPDYPPYYYEPAGWVPGTYAYGAFGFAAAAVVGSAIWGRANWWGGGVGINSQRYNSFNRVNIGNNVGNNVNWNHNPSHRGNVPYRDNATAQRFGGQGSQAARANAAAGAKQISQKGVGNRQQGAGNRQQGAGNRQPGAGNKAAGAGNRQAGAGNKQAGAGNRQAGAGQKKSGGQKAAQKKGGGQKAAQNRAGGNKSANRSGGGQRSASRGPSGGQRAANVNRGGGGGMHRSAGPRHAGGGGRSMGGGRPAAMRGGGGRGGGGGGRGGGRRSDITLKHDIALLGYLENGLGFYRFAYNGSDKAFVGVMAQEVQLTRPDVVTRATDGTLRVLYDKLGLKFQTYDEWIKSGAQVPTAVRTH
jgi:hypothetical protein